MSDSNSEMDVKVQLRSVDVDLPLFGSHNMNFKKRVAEAVSRKAPAVEHIAALRQIDLDVYAGDRIGLVGHNGAGKTTLLRVVAGILAPTRGTVRTNGNVVSMLDQSLGLDTQFTGIENIFRRGIFLNQTKELMENRLGDIIEFSGLGDRVHHPIYTYSSGMRARLAFSIATSVEPEILVMDEGLGAADADFNLRASARFKELIGRSGVLLLASHNRALIEEYCNKVVEIRNGRILQNS